MKQILIIMVAALIAGGCSWNTYRYLSAGVDARCFDVENLKREDFSKVFPYLTRGVRPYPGGGVQSERNHPSASKPDPNDEGEKEGMREGPRKCKTTVDCPECLMSGDEKNEKECLCTKKKECVTMYYPMPTKEECLEQMASIRRNTPLLIETWGDYASSAMVILSSIFGTETLNVAQ